ncbi:unnamed protein product [Polarella glacialis]|uniref:Peptidyl-prolyl cis-trans isomerase n=1 Tax=Polarella glacialis TaxID=89957 RepID=A0A813FYQ0_POLGL|nr:unnamed protein product [Polarella glacialis]
MACMLPCRCLAVAVLATLVPTWAEETFKVKFEVDRLGGEKGNTGSFVIEVHPDWAPLGAARMREIAEQKVWDTARFFRVVPGFVVQWGIPGKPSAAAKWKEDKIKDDPIREDINNLEGYITFAKSGPDTRTTQVFISLSDNLNLDSMGFPPFGKVIKGMDIVKHINDKHREAPSQGEIQSSGNVYLKKSFPDLTYIKSVSILSEEGEL